MQQKVNYYILVKISNNDNVQPVLSMDNGKKIPYVTKVYIWVIVLVQLVPKDI